MSKQKTITVIRYGEPHEMTLAKIWSECMRMWKAWKGPARYFFIQSIVDFKIDWLRRNGYSPDSIVSYCFFCTWAFERYRDGDIPSNYSVCSACPARIVSKSFDCQCKTYHYGCKPRAFARKISGLNEKRKKLEGE